MVKCLNDEPRTFSTTRNAMKTNAAFRKNCYWHIYYNLFSHLSFKDGKKRIVQKEFDNKMYQGFSTILRRREGSDIKIKIFPYAIKYQLKFLALHFCMHRPSLSPHPLFVIGSILAIASIGFCLCWILDIWIVQKILDAQKQLFYCNGRPPIFLFI